MTLPEQPAQDDAPGIDGSSGQALAAELSEQIQTTSAADAWRTSPFGLLSGEGEVDGQAPTLPEETLTHEAVDQLDDPWASSPFGSLSGGQTTPVTAGTMTLPQPTTKPKPVGPDPILLAERAGKQERKEAITEAQLELWLDTQAIRQILASNPDFVPPAATGWGSIGEEEEAERQQHLEDLQYTLDTLSQLPESLSFDPGITLIVGENGQGKSTLAKAIRYAARIAQYIQDGDSPQFARDMTFGTRSMPDILTETTAAGLAPLVSEHVSVGALQSFGPLHYYDAAEIMGASARMKIEMGRDGVRSNNDGLSHRQTIDDKLFSYIRDRRDRDLKRRAKGADEGRRPEASAGAQIYFFDEPEVGMSPSRQRQLIAELEGVMYEGSLAIVPTNSILLYESDLPRIDLEHPERGIFRPSDYPEEQS